MSGKGCLVVFVHCLFLHAVEETNETRQFVFWVELRRVPRQQIRQLFEAHLAMREILARGGEIIVAGFQGQLGNDQMTK